MAVYHPHTTDGIVISHMSVGEDSLWCWVLTRELGLIGARAQGIRKAQSKLRPHTQILTYGNFSFIRGKNSWKLVGARKHLNLYTFNPEVTPVFARILSLSKILIAGEERHPELFEVIEKAFVYSVENKLDKHHIGALERLVVLRLLYHLGYVGNESIADSYGIDSSVTKEHLEDTYKHKKDFITIINASLRETQF